MITLYLSDFILGIDNENHNLSLDNVVNECEKLFEKLKDIKKNYKYLVDGVILSKSKSICGYSLDEIIKKINNKDLKSYMYSILTTKQYLEDEQTEIIDYNNIRYKSQIVSQCYQNKGILIGIILNTQHINRLPYKDTYITLMHQENYEYIKKYVLLDDSFYLSQIYLDMLNSGYNLVFHIQAYNALCEKYYIKSSDAIKTKIKYILDGHIFEQYDRINVNYEQNGIGAIKENSPMVRIYFKHDAGNIYFLDVTNDHGDNHISKKIESATSRYNEKENLKDIFDIDDDKYLKK